MKARPQGWRRTATLFVSLALSCGASPVLAEGGGNPDATYRFDIEPGEASYRLNDFSTQSGLQVLFPFADLRGITVSAVHGEMKPFDALQKMIAGTPIRFRFSKAQALTVTFTLAPPVSAPASSAPKANGLYRAREKDRTRDSGLEEVTIRAGSTISIAATGSRPLTLTRAADIDAPGFVTVQSVFRTLPQVFGGGPTEDTHIIGTEAPTNNTSGVGVNLRGLGAGSTLVLMNGRRLPGSGTQGLYVDVSNLPLAAVERVDILPDSSSTFYGADAVGGVVNFVMRDEFEGSETEGSHSGATGGQLNEDHVSQIFGAGSKTAHGLLSFDFHSRDSLTAASRRQARSDLTEFGGANFDSLQSSPGNIVIGQNIYAIPRGQDGTSLDASDFQPGTKNLQNRYEGADILPSQQRWSIFGTGHYEPADSVNLFADLLFTRRNIRGAGGGQPLQFVVPTTNAFFPEGFTAPLMVRYNSLKDLGPLLSTAKVTSEDISTGLEWSPGRRWSLTATGGYATERVASATDNQVNPTALAAALADNEQATAFNPFSDGSNTNRATLDGLRGHASAHIRSDVLSAGALATGPIMPLWGNDLTLSLGADGRRQKFASTTFTTATTPVTHITTDRHREIRSAFAELQVPLVGPENRVRGIESLDISLAERFERYDDFGSTVAPRFGLAWAPIHGITVRGTYSESFRPPGLPYLDESTNSYGYFPLYDPRTGKREFVLLWMGMNRDLRQENAHTWTTGLEFESVERPGIAAAVTYFNTEFVDRVNQPALSADLLSNESLSALITRDPSDELRSEVCSRAPIAASGGTCLGMPVVAIADLRFRNDASVKSSGLDLLARYTRDASLGRLSLNLNGTYIFRFSEALASYMPLVNRVSTATYPINLRIRSSLRWEYGPFDISTYANFTNDYTDKASTPRRHVASWTTFDLHASYRFGPDLFEGTTASFGVDNLFNRPPPFVNNAVGIGYDQENGDLTGRVLSVTLRKKW